MTKIVRLVGGAALAIAACAVAACGTTLPGQARPAPVSASGTAASAGGAAAAVPLRPLSETDPCSLLSADAMSRFQLGRGQLILNTVEADTCQWTGEGLSLMVFNYYTARYDASLSGREMTPYEFDGGTHRAVQYRDNDGDCAISIEVAASSSVEVQATVTGGDLDRACQLAEGAAQDVEPNVPTS